MNISNINRPDTMSKSPLRPESAHARSPSDGSNKPIRPESAHVRLGSDRSKTSRPSSRAVNEFEDPEVLKKK